MGFSVNSYAKIKEVENMGKYSKVKIAISKKVPNTQPAKYICTYAGLVNFVGNAHKNRPMANQKIKITNCDVSNGFADKVTGEQKFSNSPMFTIYDYELQNDDGAPRVTVPQNNTYTPSAYVAPNMAQSAPNFEELGDEDGLPF